MRDPLGADLAQPGTDLLADLASINSEATTATAPRTKSACSSNILFATTSAVVMLCPSAIVALPFVSRLGVNRRVWSPRWPDSSRPQPNQAPRSPRTRYTTSTYMTRDSKDTHLARKRSLYIRCEIGFRVDVAVRERVDVEIGSNKLGASHARDYKRGELSAASPMAHKRGEPDGARETASRQAVHVKAGPSTGCPSTGGVAEYQPRQRDTRAASRIRRLGAQIVRAAQPASGPCPSVAARRCSHAGMP